MNNRRDKGSAPVRLDEQTDRGKPHRHELKDPRGAWREDGGRKGREGTSPSVRNNGVLVSKEGREGGRDV